MVVDVHSGAVFSITTLTLEAAISPDESSAVARHVKVSPTLVSLDTERYMCFLLRLHYYPKSFI